MDKISITVKIPALGGTYEFVVPTDMAVRDVQNLMLRILSSEYGISGSTADMMLFDTIDAAALRMECSLSQLGISDGAKLIWI